MPVRSRDHRNHQSNDTMKIIKSSVLPLLVLLFAAILVPSAAQSCKGNCGEEACFGGCCCETLCTFCGNCCGDYQACCVTFVGQCGLPPIAPPVEPPIEPPVSPPVEPPVTPPSPLRLLLPSPLPPLPPLPLQWFLPLPLPSLLLSQLRLPLPLPLPSLLPSPLRLLLPLQAQFSLP